MLIWARIKQHFSDNQVLVPGSLVLVCFYFISCELLLSCPLLCQSVSHPATLSSPCHPALDLCNPPGWSSTTGRNGGSQALPFNPPCVKWLSEQELCQIVLPVKRKEMNLTKKFVFIQVTITFKKIMTQRTFFKDTRTFAWRPSPAVILTWFRGTLYKSSRKIIFLNLLHVLQNQGPKWKNLTIARALLRVKESSLFAYLLDLGNQEILWVQRPGQLLSR